MRYVLVSGAMRIGIWVGSLAVVSCMVGASVGCGGGAQPVPETATTETAPKTAQSAQPDSSRGAAQPESAPQLELKKPIERDGKYVLEFGKVLIEVAPEEGGRISRFEYDGNNVMVDAETHDNWGSTYWTSPQSDWGWPPVPEIDEKPYLASLEGDTVVMKSKPADVNVAADDEDEAAEENKDQSPKLVMIEKRVSPDLDDEAVEITYVIHNQGKEPIQLASWEITRVEKGGLSFYPKGKGEITDEVGDFDEFPYTEEHGIVWFDQRSAEYDNHTKLAADAGAGWLAHVTPDGLLFLKQFDDVPADSQAPGEGEIELFANSPTKEDGSPDTQYVEVENQGVYQTIEPGGQSEYTVRWTLQSLPSDVEVKAGSEKLAAHVRSLTAIADE